MEKRFDMTNFEQSLKDQADQLNMIPSKRVWNGIYNNLHPGSSWPSGAMFFLFLFTILGIGHLNNTKKLSGINYQPQSQSKIDSEFENELISPNESQKKSNSAKQDLQNKPGTYFKGDFTANIQKIQHLKANILDEFSVKTFDISAKLISLYPDKMPDFSSEKIAGVLKVPLDKMINNDIETEIFNPKATTTNSTAHSLYQIPEQRFNLNENESLNINSNLGRIESTEIIQTDISNFITNNRVYNEQVEKMSWLFYITPSLTTATFLGKENQAISSNSNSSSLIIRGNQNSIGMTYNSRMGFETGTEMSYTFWKKLQFITGIHFSYSGYNVVSNQVHPTFATLVLKQETSGLPYSKGYMTHYGNGQSQNQISLSNYSFQISIPVGLQQALFENKKIRIDIATTIEPSYVLNSNAFLISSNERYYVKDPELLRKINLSSHAGTFVTLKTQKFKWQLGPTVRYQLLSTYQKTYPVKEHLLDYGIRIGISK